MNDDRQAQCRAVLVKVAEEHGKITYSDLGKEVGLPPQSAGMYLDAIYEAEVSAGRPDLTLVVVSKATGFGPYVSLGGPTKSVKFDAKNPDHRKRYDDELNRVYAFNWRKTNNVARD